MPITTKRHENETIGSMLRRFSRRVQYSRTILKARKARFYRSSKSKPEKRLTALYRVEVQKLRSGLEKMGITDEDEIERAVQKFKQRWRSEH